MKNYYLTLVIAMVVAINASAQNFEDSQSFQSPSGMSFIQYQTQGGAVLDSILIYNNVTVIDSLLFGKYEYAYFENKMSEALYFWDKDNKKWLFSKKHSDSLDSENRVVEEINFKEDKGVWVFYTKKVFVYAQNKKTANVFYEWNNSEKIWVESWKYEYSFRTDGAIEQQRYFSEFSVDDSIWVIYSKIDYTYNLDNKLLTEIDSSTFGSTKFTPEFKTGYTYNNKGLKSADSTYRWKNNNWQYYSKQQYDYNSKDSLTRITRYKYIPIDLTWKEDVRFDYDYDVAGNLVLAYESSWDTTLSKWHGYSISEWSYNSKNDLKLYLSRSYDLNLNLWSGFKHEYTYNPYRSIVYSLDYIWNKDLYDFVFDTKSFYYYTGEFNEIKPNIDFAAIAVFPNPCTNILKINTSEIRLSTGTITTQITDLTGRIIVPPSQFQATSQIELNTSSIPKGCYLLNIQIGKESRTFKFLKN